MKRHYLKRGVVKVCGVYTNVGIELTDKEEDIIVCEYLIRWVMQHLIKCSLISSWYSWKIVHLAVNNNHSLNLLFTLIPSILPGNQSHETRQCWNRVIIQITCNKGGWFIQVCHYLHQKPQALFLSLVKFDSG
jgi:hypothetical protein